MAASSIAVGGAAREPFANRRAIRATAIALAACLIAVLGFIAGEHHRSGTRPPGVTVLSGVAYVGLHEASVTVGGWVYGIQGTGNLTWVDSQGSTHTFGWPSCLRAGGYVPIRFGEVPVTAPSGGTWRQVVWVDCRSA